MIIVHDIFVCKPGNASKAAKMFKETMGKDPNVSYILTDMTGQFHRVIMVSEYESLSHYEKSLEEMMNPKGKMAKQMKEMEEKFKGFQDMYVSGSREIYRSW